MQPGQAAMLALFIQKRRLKAGLSKRELAERSGLQLATVAGLEAGAIQSPQPDTVASLAGPLGLTVSDLYTAAGWLPADELPTLRPYMRAKYADLSDDDVGRIEAFIDQLSAGRGPRDHEDE